MSKSIETCPGCGSEVLVQRPGCCVGTHFWAYCYSNRRTERRMLKALDLIATGAGRRQEDEDLQRALQMARESHASIMAQQLTSQCEEERS